MTKRQAKEIEALASTPDDEIDTSDIPEAKDWSRAEVSKFYWSTFSAPRKLPG